MAGLWLASHVKKAVIYGKKITACTHKRDIPVAASSLLQIRLIITEIILFIKSDLDLHLQVQPIRHFCCQPQWHHWDESFVKIGHIIDEI